MLLRRLVMMRSFAPATRAFEIKIPEKFELTSREYEAGDKEAWDGKTYAEGRWRKTMADCKSGMLQWAFILGGGMGTIVAVSLTGRLTFWAWDKMSPHHYCTRCCDRIHRVG